MSLYAIGDLHLHFQSEVKSKAQRKDRLWKRNDEKFQKNCLSLLKEEDTLVLVGDHSWGRKVAECEQDFQYLRHCGNQRLHIRGPVLSEQKGTDHRMG